jgi:hypothetical protein
MAKYETTVTTPAPPEQVFDYLADFSSVAQWDPTVVEAEQLSGRPGRAGARYRVVVRLGLVSFPFEYRVLESTPPADGEPGRVVLRAENSNVISRDVITVSADGWGSQVRYEANLEPKGVRKLFDLGFGVTMTVIGVRARAGLESSVRALAGPEA